MNRILLATDFSEPAARAAQLAEAMARRTGHHLVLLHVAAAPTDRPLELAADARAFEAALRERARDELAALASGMRARDLLVEERLEVGDPAEVIAAVAREVNAGLVVLGNHGRRALARLVLGSVARGTLSLTDRPVLVARADCTGEALVEWASGRRALRVVVGVDRSPGSAAALAWVGWLRGVGRVDVRVVHAYNTVLETLRLGLRPAAEVTGDLSSTLERELRTLVGSLPGEGLVSLVLRDDDDRRAAEVLAREASQSEADLLVVGVHARTRLQRMWLGATGELLLRAAPVPVVCVPAVSRGRLEDDPRPDEVC
jgi:nucleotide-binding universal stress UspA family protein